MGLIVIVVLLLVIMPGLLYLLGAGVKRYTEHPPAWLGALSRRSRPADTRAAAAPGQARPAP